MDLLASSLGDVGDFITGIATSVIALTAIATASFALTQYRKDVGERHGRWLMDLPARFADASRHDAMLLELYRGDESDLAKALTKRQAIRDDGSGDTLDEAEREARSIPISCITSTTAGHTPSRRGSWPADSARTSSGTRRLNSASAICERPAALARLEELRDAEWTRDDTAERMRGMYEYRRSRLAARAGETDDGDGYEHRSRKYQKMVRAVIEAQRAEIVRLRNAGLISNEIMHRVERELDLEDERLEI